MPIVKAAIAILDKAAIDPTRGLLPIIPVMFNPTEYSLEKGAQISEIAIPGLDSPILQFVRGQTKKLSLDLFFDTTALGMGAVSVDVRLQTNSIYQLVKIQPKTHAPPRVRFIWGAGLNFKGIVENVQQKFTLFSPAGTPLRATLSVTFKQYKTVEEQVAKLNLQSADHTKRRVVKRGETLTQIASEEYDDARSWRHIAQANNITNPRQLVPGTALFIPPLDAFSDPVLEY